MVRELCIIGFGISGIACLRWAKEYNIDAIVFEKNSTFGGCWHTSSYKSAILQTRKNSYSFSDMPMPDSFNNYPTRDEILQYLEKYIDFHNLNQDVYYNQEISNIFYNNSTKLWEIDIQNTKSLKFYKVKSKYIAICSGFYSKPNIIDLPIKNSFNGKIFHSKEFSFTGQYDYSIFKDKKVVLIGNGPTGCDLSCAAVENGAKSVTLLYKTDRWILNRYFLNIELDFLMSRFFINLALKLPTSLFLAIFYVIYLIPRLYYKIYYKLPNSKINRNNVAVNECLFPYISEKKIVYKKGLIKSVDKNTIILEDNSAIDTDLIVMCTGFKQGTHFFDDFNLNILYKRIVPIDYPKCGFIGFAPSFNWVQNSDLQSRWFLNWIKNDKKVSRKTMIREIIKTHKKHNELNLEYFDLSYTPIQYLDDLSKDLNIDIEKNYFDYKYWLKAPAYNYWS